MNMNKEIRKELGWLEKERRDLERALDRVVVVAQRDLREIERIVLHEQKTVNKKQNRLGRRMAILRGRLS